MFTLIGYDAQEIILPNYYVYTFLLSLVAVTVVFYLLRSIAIFTMSKNQNLKCAWISWVPCVWIYVAFKLMGKAKFFGKPVEKIAWIFALVYSIGQVVVLFFNLVVYFPVIGNFLHGNDLYILLVSDSKLYTEYAQSLTTIWGNFRIFGGANYVNPFENMGLYIEVLAPLFNGVSLLSRLSYVVCSIIVIILYVNLFRTYWPEHFLLASVLSYVGAFAPFVFAVRKRKQTNYAEYLRNKFKGTYANGNPYGGNPYTNYNPNQNYNNYNANNTRQTPPDPFNEFSNKAKGDPGDPFEEFSNKDRK